MVIISDKDLEALQDNSKNVLIAKIRLLETRYQQSLQLIESLKKDNHLLKERYSDMVKQNAKKYDIIRALEKRLSIVLGGRNDSLSW